jgi:phosphomannomutase
VKQRLHQRGADIVDIDGVRVKSSDGWWLMRASNTQAVIVVRAESTTQAGLVRLKAQLAAELAPSGLTLPE